MFSFKNQPWHKVAKSPGIMFDKWICSYYQSTPHLCGGVSSSVQGWSKTCLKSRSHVELAVSVGPSISRNNGDSYCYDRRATPTFLLWDHTTETNCQRLWKIGLLMWNWIKEAIPQQLWQDCWTSDTCGARTKGSGCYTEYVTRSVSKIPTAAKFFFTGGAKNIWAVPNMGQTLPELLWGSPPYGLR